jgi:hypothetical protein
MPKVSSTALREVEHALQHYTEEVEQTAMTETSKGTYLLHAQHFVRWLNDDFEPGAWVS